MPNSNSVMIHRLQKAINTKFEEKLLLNRRQWYSEKEHRPITVYIISKAIYDDDTKKTKSNELFSSTSELQIVLFLRDYWYTLNGWEVPTDNEEWNKAKALYYSRVAKGANAWEVEDC